MASIQVPEFSTTDVELLPVSKSLITSVSQGAFASRELYNLRLLAEHALLVSGFDELISLSQYHQRLSLEPARLEKNIERARLMGITPPVQLRRTRDGYLLLDGLYRLRAAESLGLERIPAVVE